MRAEKVKVWSVASRLWHWSLVTFFFISYFGNDDRFVHEGAGYIVLGLLIARVIWGFVGSTRDRFVDFVPGPRMLLHYLADLARGKPKRYLGHNPAGGAMILAFVIMLAVVTGSGVLMTTETYWGNQFVEDVHRYSTDALLMMIPLHVGGAILSSFLHRENLILAFITGRKRPLEPGEAESVATERREPSSRPTASPKPRRDQCAS